MSYNSEQRDGGIRGFPSNCSCGVDVKVFTSKTQDNPGRPIFVVKAKKDKHLFKWVEDAVFEEVQDVLPRVGVIESEISHTKFEIEELKVVIEGLKEEVIWSKNEISKWKLLAKAIVVCFCVLVVVVIYQMIGKGIEKNVMDY